MSFACVYSRASLGFESVQISVEADLSNGIPRFSIVGLADQAVREAKERVRSALLNCHFEFPAKRITVNLAPCDLPKDGGQFDLPIALAILAASDQIDGYLLEGHEFIGELGLAGELCRIKNSLAIAKGASEAGRALVLPMTNVFEAARITDLTLYPAMHLDEVILHFKGRKLIEPFPREKLRSTQINYADMAEVRGQTFAKRALEIAAAGGHNVLMVGPPGVGKTMLASRFPGILPPLKEAEVLETALIYSYCSRYYPWGTIPFREPHHTSSYAAVVGGSNPPKPGEISLAHHGVLFLDELTEFKRPVLEALREPLEAKKINIVRANHSYSFPAQFQLIAAMNPCPCGHHGNPLKSCTCSEIAIQKYRQKISGPILDRIDLQIYLAHDYSFDYREDNDAEHSEQIRARVLAAREKQYERWEKSNMSVDEKVFYQRAYIPESVKESINELINQYHLSARVALKILRVARTIADLEDSVLLERRHLLEALNYRMKSPK